MKYRTRTHYTDSQKSVMWERWKESWMLHQIALLFERSHGSVRSILARTGGGWHERPYWAFGLSDTVKAKQRAASEATFTTITHPSGERLHVSRETIYRSLWAFARFPHYPRHPDNDDANHVRRRPRT